MRFIVDAQLPRKLSRWLSGHGHDSIHTLDLPDKNTSEDHFIADHADATDRIVVSKDADFVALKLLEGKPKKLLLVKTGNLSNDLLIQIFKSNIEVINKLFETFEIVEIHKTMVGGANLDSQMEVS